MPLGNRRPTPARLPGDRIGLVALTILALLSPTPSIAQNTPVNFLNPINDVGLISPLSPPKPGGPDFYSWTGPSPGWRIAQWNMPGSELSPFKSTKSAGQMMYSSSSPEASVNIFKSGKGIKVDLSQDGSVLPCAMQNGVPRESDLLIGANGPNPKLPGVPGLALLGRNNPPLSDFGSVKFGATLSVISGPAKTSKGCGFNVGRALVGIVLSDRDVRPPQTMFYQLALAKFCGSAASASAASCRANPPAMQIFHPSSPLGVNDFLPLLGNPLLASGQTSTISVDVLPRLEAAIANGPAGMDTDLSHWTLSGFYVGQHIWGDMALQSSWQNVSLMGYTN